MFSITDLELLSNDLDILVQRKLKLERQDLV